MMDWPPYLNHVPEKDRQLFKESVAALLSSGSILRSDAQDAYDLARSAYFQEIEAFLSVLDIDLIPDDDSALLQARPKEACLLTARFSKAETLIVLSLWRIYYEAALDGQADEVIITIDDLHRKLKEVYFPDVQPPAFTQCEAALKSLQRLNLVRYKRDDRNPDASEVQVLRTIRRIIPFASLEEWNKQATLFSAQEPASNGEATAL